MEKKSVNVTREELNEFMKQIEGIKSTIEILQNDEIMGQIRESEQLKKSGAKLLNLDI